MVASLAVWPAVGGAQAPRFEAGIQALGVLADADYAGAGPWLAWRPSSGIRLGVLGTVGAQSDRTAGRIELVGHFLLDPGRTRGIGLYGLAGLGWSIADDSRGVLIAGVGAETAPGGRAGWALELGVAGGWRISAGYRRRFGARPRVR